MACPPLVLAVAPAARATCGFAFFSGAFAFSPAFGTLPFNSFTADLASLRARFAAFLACLKALRACLNSALTSFKLSRAALANFFVAAAFASRDSVDGALPFCFWFEVLVFIFGIVVVLPTRP